VGASGSAVFRLIVGAIEIETRSSTGQWPHHAPDPAAHEVLGSGARASCTRSCELLPKEAESEAPTASGVPIPSARRRRRAHSRMSFDLVPSLFGGVLIGCAAALLLLTHGQIAGISGIVRGALLPAAGAAGGFRYAFLLGLLSGGAVLGALWPERFDMRGAPAWPLPLIAGLLVGIGTYIGGGCTSCHGVCGIGRGSRRSIAATITFMLVAGLTLLAVRRLS
jgi:hypothetical protein